MKKLIPILSLLALTAGGGEPGKIDVLCIYYPEWHVYPEWEAYYGKGTTEWMCVSNTVARFPGHHQPIVPLMGFYDESDPKVAAQEIDLAADAGIDVFLYDWYWANGKPIQHEGLERGFLKAPNKDRMRFALMWAYHDRDVPFQSKFGEEKKHHLWKLARTEADFLAAFAYCAKAYFGDPAYYRKDGRIFFSLYASDAFVKDMGGPAKARAALAKAQALVRARGLPPVHFNAMVFNAGNAGPAIAAGFDSTSVYTIHGFHSKKGAAMERSRQFVMAYDDLVETSDAVNRALAEVSPMHIPVVVRGWDCTARCDPAEPFPWRASRYPYMGIFAGATPAKFERALRTALKRAAEDPRRPGAILINAWNEYTEGSWLVPDTRNGRAYLDAVSRACGRPRRCP